MIKQIIEGLKTSPSILENTLSFYGSLNLKNKKNRNCIHCKSSDALHINTKNNTYKCFSCGTGGSVIDLVMNMESTDFIGAIKILCTQNGINFPNEKKELSSKDKAKLFIKKELYKFQEEKKNNIENLKNEALKNKDIDKAFTLDCQIDKLNIKTLEYANYSKYKPNKTYEIDKYISEQEEGLILALNKAREGQKVLILAPTGGGKTDLTLKTIKDKNIDSCFISPNASNVEQIINTYNIPGAFGEIVAEEVYKNNTIKAFTWDKFQSLKVDLSNSIAIVDEIHQTFNDMYRSDKIKGLYSNLERCKGRIDITATPNKLDFRIYDFIVEYKKKEQTNYNVKLYTNFNDDEVIKIINNSKKFAILENNSKHLQYYQTTTSKKTDIITRPFVNDNKSKTYDMIMKNSNISNYEGLLNSSIIVAGVNIYDKDITDIIIIGEKDISTIKQYVARFRDLKDVNVHIFNKYEDISTSYEIEWVVEQKIYEIQQALEGINYFNKRQLQECNVSFKAMKLEKGNHFYYDEKSNEYKISIPEIKHEVYSNYYQKSDIVSFKELLKEYFTNISIINIKEHISENKKEFTRELKLSEEEAIKQLENHLNILVGANEILKGKASKKLLKYLELNELSTSYILDKLKENNIEELISIGNNIKLIELYTKYVVENGFTYEFAWYLCNLGNVKRGKIFQQLNKIVFRMLEKNHPQLINNHLIENKLHNFIINEFKPGVSYTQEHLEHFIELVKIAIPGLKLTINKLGGNIKDIYTIEENKINICPGVDKYFYRNMLPTPGQNKRINLYTIKDFKNINDIIVEHKITQTSVKSLQSMVENRYKNIIKTKEAQEILQIDKIFLSK